MRHARSDYDDIQPPADKGWPDDEPVLLIRGQDTLAPQMARIYSALTRSLVGGQPSIADRLDDWADHIEAWQAGNREKIADAPRSALGGDAGA